MKLVVAAVLLCVASVHSQSCADDCKIVCGDQLTPSVLTTSPSGAYKRGKHGPKGQKGEVGLPGVTGVPGKDGYDNSDLVSKLEKSVAFLKEIVYEGFGKVLGDKIAKKCGLGLQEKSVVADGQITCGSYHQNLEQFSAKQARLFSTSGSGAWAAGYTKPTNGVFHDDVWIQVDFLSDKQVEGVVTQGRHNVGQWVKEYKVEYMEDGSDSFKTVLDENGQPLIFEGNSDYSTPVVNTFKKKIMARVFRIRVKSYNNYPSMRFDFISC